MKELDDPRIEWIVIWEPVVESDLGPPSRELTATIPPARSHLFWDEKLATSDAILRAARARGVSPDELPPPGQPAWDVALVFPPGARWDDAVPQNTWHGYPVVDNIDGLRAALTALR